MVAFRGPPGLRARYATIMTQTPEPSRNDPADIKAAARAAAFARRKAARDAVDPAPALAALERELRDAGARIVAGYMAIRTEIDPAPVMEALRRDGVRICVPVIEAPGAPLSFREWSPGVRMVEGPFGARIPAEGATLEPDALIVPLVAFDAALNRLGYGGGFYDRTLARLRARRPTRAIGFAYAAQQADSLPVEPTDEPLDAVATERGTLRR